jgi:hypothetical protein
MYVLSQSTANPTGAHHETEQSMARHAPRSRHTAPARKQRTAMRPNGILRRAWQCSRLPSEAGGRQAILRQAIKIRVFNVDNLIDSPNRSIKIRTELTSSVRLNPRQALGSPQSSAPHDLDQRALVL